MNIATEILKFFKVVLAFLALLFVAVIICFFLIYLYFLVLMGGGVLSFFVVWASALGYGFYKYRTPESRKIQTPTRAALWRVALAGIGFFFGLVGAITMHASTTHVVYESARGVQTDVEPKLLLVISVIELIIAAVCLLFSRFWRIL